MKPRIRPLLLCLVAVVAMFLVSCLDSNTEPEPPTTDVSAANAKAREGMNLMNQTILDLNNTDPEFNNSEDLMTQATFDNIKSKFNAALALDANNPMANLGLAILAIVEINYDPVLWTMLEDAGFFEEGSKRIINNQFQFLAGSPFRVLQQMSPTKTEPMSIMRVQNFIKNNILPRIDNAIGRLDNAIALADSTVLIIEVDEEETVEIDRGEIYAFRATTNAVKAGFNLMVAYDMDMKDSLGGYTWIDDIDNIEAPGVNTWDAYGYDVVGGILYRDYYNDNYNDEYVQAHSLELQMKTMKYNLDNSTTFGKLTGTGAACLNTARAAILSAAADVKLGADYILAETDPQDNDIIAIEDINSINSEIPPTGEDTPAFAQDWENVNDIADWLTTVLNSTYPLTVNGVNFEVNAGAFFNGAIADIENYIPYIHWNSLNSEWAQEVIDDEWGWTPWDTTVSFWCANNFVTVENITYVYDRYHGFDLDWGYDADAAGNQLPEDEFLHFPDYTFNGIMPNMTRQKLIDIFG